MQSYASIARAATTEQLCHWVQQLKARPLDDEKFERLEIFFAELAKRGF